MNEIVLQGRGICKSYGSKRNRRQVLFDVDIEVRSGECLAIIGASGSGKSTLTRVLFGLESADCGEIAYHGQAMGERNDAVRHMLRGETGLVFQDPFASLDPRWRVARSVEEPLRLRHRGMGDDEAAARIGRALRLVGLDPAVFAARYPMDLSGGQAQRVAIARAIVDDPGVILADEPTGALDSGSTEELLRLFGTVNGAGQTIVMVTHSVRAASCAGRVLFLRDGAVAQELTRGTDTETAFYRRIADALTASQTGGGAA